MGEEGDGGSGELLINLSNSTLEVDQRIYVKVTLTATNNTGNVTILVRDPDDLPILMESVDLEDGKATFMFSLFDWHVNGTYSVNATAHTSDDQSYNATGRTFEFVNWTPPSPPPPPDTDNTSMHLLWPHVPLIVVAGMTSVSFFLAYSTDKGKYGLWIALTPLYSRLRKSEALDDFNRGQIYRTISEHPGVRYSEIRNKVGIGNGVLTYHLKVLQNMRYVKGVGDKTLKRFYLWGETAALPPDLDKPFTPIQRSIVDYLSKNIWSTQKDMAEALHDKQQTVSKNLKKLEQANIVKRVKEVNVFRYHLSEGYLHWLSQQISPKCPTCLNVCRIGAKFCENCGTRLDMK